MEIIVKGADFSENRIGVVAKKINTAVFNGTSSYASVTPITLSSDGDYIEMLLNVEETTLGNYFVSRELWNKICFGITKTRLSLRLDDNTWAVNNQTIAPADTSNVKVKIAIDGTNIKVYIDDVLAFTYDNSSTQSSVTIAGFGKYEQTQVTNYWKGSIKKVRTNKAFDGAWVGIDEFAGWSATDVTII